jgi:PPOX class probable F420-dependent enzyme
MSRKMTDEQAREFLRHGQRTGKVATTRADGRPHVAPVWFVLDGADIVFMTGAETLKGKTLRRDPRMALVVDLEAPP